MASKRRKLHNRLFRENAERREREKTDRAIGQQFDLLDRYRALLENPERKTTFPVIDFKSIEKELNRS